jgi:hypothetical protein
MFSRYKSFKLDIVENDIKFGTECYFISRKQFFVSFTRSRNFRICDTSSSNPIEIMLVGKKRIRLHHGSIFTLGPDVSFVVVKIVLLDTA